MPGPSLFHSLFLSDFTVLDYAFVCPRLGLRGDSYFVSAELEGTLDDKDFLLDFGPAKKILKALVDEAFDHKLLVPMGAGVATLRGDALEISTPAFSALYESPREAIELFPDAELSPAVIEYHLARLAKAKLPANVAAAKFRLSSSPRFQGEANFRYTHGLRRHDGNCQRLFHGHRNPVEVWVGGKRAPNWEQALAGEWHDAHFVCAETLANRRELDLPLGRRAHHHPGTAVVEYTSPQGRFRASLPAARVVLVEGEPSIETISVLGAKVLREKGLGGEFQVVAYEGLNKGSRFTSLP